MSGLATNVQPADSPPSSPASSNAWADVPPPVDASIASITPARVLALVRALPTKRASDGDAAHVQGLKQTEHILEEALRTLGYEPELQAIDQPVIALKSRKPSQTPSPDGSPPAPSGDQPNPTVPARPTTPTDDANKQQPPTDAELSKAKPEWHNLIIELPGVDHPAEVLILTAHFDAADGAPGADDDGTGVAAILELARVLKDVKLKRTVRLILFNQEEIGLIGSVHYVRTLKPKLDRSEETIIGMVSLEMLGYFIDKPNSQRSPIPSIPGVFEAPTVGDFIGMATTKRFAPFAERLDRELRKAEPTLKTVVAASFVPNLPITPRDLLRSDHAPFIAVGQPGVILTDTSNFRNPHYHRATDTVDTLDGERFALVVRAVAGAAIAIAEPVDATASEPPAKAKP